MKRQITAAVVVLSLVLAGPMLAAGSKAGDEQIVSQDKNGVPTWVKGDLGTLDKGLAVDLAAVDFLGDLVVRKFDAAGDEHLVVQQVQRDHIGKVHVRIDQQINGLPVIGAQLIVHAEADTGEVYAVNGNFLPNKGLPTESRIKAADALAMALAEAGIFGTKSLDQPQLVYVIGADEDGHLAWRGTYEYEDLDGRYQVDQVFANAVTGALAARHPQVHYAKSWRTYDGNNGSSLPGSLRCTNGSCTGADAVETTIHNNTSTAYDYFNARFGRDSYNGSGATINSTGHHRSNYVNAFWNGSQLVYGDGDGSTSGPLGDAFDVVAHELTHAVTQFTSNLIYQNESGALNEGMSDIFAAGAEAYRDGSINSGTWLVGEDTWTPGTSGDALRYMNNPTLDGSSRDYWPTRYTGSADNGGVHWNSGIANLAFYLLVQGGTHPRGLDPTNVTAIGMSKAEQIFYRAQTTYLTASSNFQAARNATVSAAGDLYGSAEVDSVNDAWCAVGVPGCPGSGPGPGSCPSGFTTYTGTINAGQSLVTSGVTTSGGFNATLTGSAPDIDLYLQRESCSWFGCSWSNVASSTSASSTESISYTTTSSRKYRWRVFGYSGNGITFTLCANPAL
ncbi:MAG: M4 family metallopeptidase [Acidobacteriota bacterium]